MHQFQTNLAWDTFLDLDDGTAGRGPLHQRLTRALRSAIQSGRLPPGIALPPTRALAESIGCSRWAVTEAYEQLAAEGYVSGRVGSGTRVRWREESGGQSLSAARPDAANAGIDLAPGLPDLRAFPRERWMASLRATAAALPYTRLGYPERGGEWRLREVLAAYLARVRGASTAASEITICTGVTDGITRACRAMHESGIAAVAVEDPGWTRLRQAIALAGPEVVPVPVDDEGLRVDRLAAHPAVGAVVISPAHQFPTGTVLSPERRAALLAWARAGGGLILEDDYDAEFRYDRRPVGTLQGADPSRVALLGSLSKTLSPALGIGWIATPPAWTARVRAAEIRVAEPPVLDQLAFATLLETGNYDRHLRAARKRYRARRDRLVAELTARIPAARIAGAAAGLHLLLHLDASLDTAAVARRAGELGVQVASIDSYRVENDALGPALVLGYGNLGDAEIAPGVAALAAAIAEATATSIRRGEPSRPIRARSSRSS